MASLSKDKAGNRTIQFVAGDRKRRSIRLGKTPQKAADTIKSKVEALNAAAISGTSWDADTAAWVGSREAWLYDKLADVGLVPKRAAREQATLEAFLDAYVVGRSDVKGATATVFGHTRRCLVEFFGANKPLADINPADADAWRRWLAKEQKLADNTVRRRCGIARQFLRAAVQKRLISQNPFGELKGVAVRANRSRDHFISRADAARVLDACPDAEWRLIFALSRYGGLRCPSETLELRWSDVDWAANRITVRSPKTEGHEGKELRVMPLFPELRTYLQDAFDPEAVFVVTRYRGANVNLRTQLERIVAKAGVKVWPKLFQNLRATRATELAADHPAHVAAAWLGHSRAIAQEHYWQIRNEDFAKAIAAPVGEALHDPVQSAAVSNGSEQEGAGDGSEISEKAADASVPVGAGVGDAGLEIAHYV